MEQELEQNLQNNYQRVYSRCLPSMTAATSIAPLKKTND